MFVKSLYTLTAALMLAGLAAIPLPAMAQDVSTFASCVGTDNDIERLACFDRAASELPGAKGEMSAAVCTQMTVEDLKLDYTDLLGKCVEVRGFLMSAGDIALLSEGVMDASPFIIDTARLTRDERRDLLRCQQGCPGSVIGMVGDVTYSKGLKASNLAIN